MESILQTGLAQLGLLDRVPEHAPAQLAQYGRMLLDKNQVMNLTAIREEDRVARLHMLDCAALLSCTDFSAVNTLIDVGTGAGFPGLALKILQPHLDVTLLDSLNKRLDWLEEVAQSLSLTGVHTLHARAEEQALKKGFRDHFDLVTARAVADLRLLTELCLPYARVGGLFLAMKAADCQEELDRAAHAIQFLGGRVEKVACYEIPGTDVTRRAILIRKVAPTLKGYPRRWAKISKDPL